MTQEQPVLRTVPIPRTFRWGNWDALDLQDVFPDMEGDVLRRPELMHIAGVARWSAELHQRDDWWRLECENEDFQVWTARRRLRLSEPLTLTLIREGRIAPQELELIFSAGPPKRERDVRHELQLESWQFSATEWEIADWYHFSDRKMALARQSLHRANIDADFRPKFFKFRLNLIPRPVNLQEHRLVAYRATFAAQDGQPVFGEPESRR